MIRLVLVNANPEVAKVLNDIADEADNVAQAARKGMDRVRLDPETRGYWQKQLQNNKVNEDELDSRVAAAASGSGG